MSGIFLFLIISVGTKTLSTVHCSLFPALFLSFFLSRSRLVTLSSVHPLCSLFPALLFLQYRQIRKAKQHGFTSVMREENRGFFVRTWPFHFRDFSFSEAIVLHIVSNFDI